MRSKYGTEDQPQIMFEVIIKFVRTGTAQNWPINDNSSESR